MKQNKKPEANTSNPKENEKKDFPGYPHYPKNEDVMNSDERVDTANMDEMQRGSTASNSVKKKTNDLAAPAESETPQTSAAETLREKAAFNFNPNDDDEVEFVDGTDADITEEEVDELERDGVSDHNFHPDELDVPGAELDDDSEEIGEEDEENNYYSLGGDEKENLEENGKE